MRRILLILAIIMFWPHQSRASWVEINFDEATIAAMIATYESELLIEQRITAASDSILSSYKHALPALEAIYIAKQMEHKALRNISQFVTAEENAYYRRAYRLFKMIVNELYVVAGYMIKDPSTAIYWGNYLWEVTDEIKMLAYQFESIVTNGKLSFAEIGFIDLAQTVKSVLSTYSLSVENYQAVIDDMIDVSWVKGLKDYSNADLVNDLASLAFQLKSMLSDKVQDKVDYATNYIPDELNWLPNPSQQGLVSTLINKVATIKAICEQAKTIYKAPKSTLTSYLLGVLGTDPDVRKLFEMSHYDISSWMLEQAGAVGTEYTQFFEIVKGGYEVVVDYKPRTTDQSIKSGAEWYRIAASSYGPPPASLIPVIRKISQTQAGISSYETDDKVTENLLMKAITENGKIVKMAYAFEIKVERPDPAKVVYSKTYNSYTMDLKSFEMEMESKLREFQNNDPDNAQNYYIRKSQLYPYTIPDDVEMLRACEKVILTSSCTHGGEIENGEITYKCGTCKNAKSAHAHTCSMASKYSDEDHDPISDQWKQRLAEDEAVRADLIRQRDIINLEIKRCTESMNSLLPSQRNAMRDKILKLQKQKSEIEEQITVIDEKIRLDREAYAEAKAEDDEIHFDDVNRIPYIKSVLAQRYNLKWDNDGYWAGQQLYVCTAHPKLAKDSVGTATDFRFQAELSTVADKNLLHRARIKIIWKLVGNSHTNSVIGTINLDASMSDEQRQRIVAEAIADAQTDLEPGCSVSAEYIKIKNIEIDPEGERTYHLLWASDRLEIASNVCNRLAAIYGTLVGYEKMLHYKVSLEKVLKSVLNGVDNSVLRARRDDITSICQGKWWEALVDVNQNKYQSDKNSNNGPDNEQ